MHPQNLFLKALSGIGMRSFIIITFAVMWYGLAIPVEGRVSEKDIINEIAGAENCLKAMDAVKDNYHDLEKVKAFIKLCEEFIHDIHLTEEQMEQLKAVGYDPDGKNSKESVGDKKSKNGRGTDSSASDKKDQDKEEDKKPSSEKMSKDGESARKKDDAIKPEEDKKPSSEKKSKDGESARKKDDAIKPEEDTKQQKVKSLDDPKAKISERSATKSDPKDEPKETETQTKDTTTSESEAATKSEPVQSDSKPVIQEELEDKIVPILDLSKLNDPALTPEEIDAVFAELDKATMLPEPSPQPGFQEQAGFQDPNVAGIHGAQFGFSAQFAQQFGQGEPQFLHHEFRAQFPDLGLGAGIPQGAAIPDHLFQQGIPQGAAIPNPTFQQGIPPFPQQQGVPPFPQQQDVPPFPQQQGVPPFPQQQDVPPFPQQQGVPPFPQQQGVPPFPQQQHFEAHFAHQQFVQVPPDPRWAQWGADLPNQGIPQPEENVVGETSQTSEQQQAAQESNKAKPKDEPSTKRKVDEL